MIHRHRVPREVPLIERNIKSIKRVASIVKSLARNAIVQGVVRNLAIGMTNIKRIADQLSLKIQFEVQNLDRGTRAQGLEAETVTDVGIKQ